MRKMILSSPVDVLSRLETLSLIERWIRESRSMKVVVTAYSEFFVRATQDTEFSQVMNEADLVTPDGVSVLAAVRYTDRTAKTKSWLKRFFEGLRAGREILGGLGESVTGVWLFEELTAKAEECGWKVFLLGGWDGVALKTAKKLQERFPRLKVESDEGEARVGTDKKKNLAVVEKINRFEPDILFVAYNPIKQEKWLMKHKSKLKAKIGIGVGGTFNEYLGLFPKAPIFFENHGLKWLWRLLVEPRARFGRIMRAVVVFPWLVFRGKRQ